MSVFSEIVHPRKVLDQHGLRPKKSFGQNFMLNQKVLAAIAQAVDSFSPQAQVIEFGAGLGALTTELLSLDRALFAVERDRDLLPILMVTFADALAEKKLVLVEADAKSIDAVQFAATDGTKPVLCGNLPYHITNQLLRKAIDSYEDISGCVFLIQSEVAERMVSDAGNKIYGVLSILAQARFDIAKVIDVPREDFWPIPGVDSAVICLRRKNAADLPVYDWNLFVRIVKSAFAHRRKTLRNCLNQFDQAEERLQAVGLNGTMRAEAVSVEQYIALCQEFARHHA